MNPRKIAAAIAAFAIAASFAAADEVTDSIDEGRQAYASGDYASAASSFEYAAQLIRQMKGKALEAHFPDALKGWEAAGASSSTMGGAMFGGGVSAEREYTKGDSSVTIRILSDSPMMQSVMMFINNPMFAAASPDVKLERVAGQKVMTEFDDDRGTINAVVGGSILVSFEGSEVSLDELKAYVNAFDFKGLAASL